VSVLARSLQTADGTAAPRGCPLKRISCTPGIAHMGVAQWSSQALLLASAAHHGAA